MRSMKKGLMLRIGTHTSAILGDQLERGHIIKFGIIDISTRVKR